jgi:cytoskeletal protein CcmA (bactofilin family)
MKKTSLILALVPFLLLIPFSVLAFSVKADESVYVPATETIEGNFYVAGTSVTIDGEIKGDVICAGRTVTINGKVEGDVICAAQNLSLRGPIGGSVRLLGETVTIDSRIERGLQFAGVNLILGEASVVGWDALVGAETMTVQGKINGDLHGSLSQLEFDGEAGRDVKLRLASRADMQPSLKLGESAIINGNLYYSAGAEGSISQQAEIGGDYGFSLSEKPEQKNRLINYAWSFIISVFSALVVGLVLISFFRKKIQSIIALILSRPGAMLSWGIIVMFIIPIICLLLLLTLIGIPLSLMLITTWAITLYLGKVVTGIAAGKLISQKIKGKKNISIIWMMIFGVVAVWIITALPLIGWVFSLLATWLGMGAIYLSFKK